jgi:sialate O-acetylesterase
LALGARANVTLPALFSDHAVLQRDAPIPVWGWADPGEVVSVTLREQTAHTVAGDDGAWRVTLPAMREDTPCTLTVVGKNTLTVQDVALGDVWLCSGQSNMEWTVRQAANADAETAAANFPRIRHFKVARTLATTPQRDVRGSWVVCTPETAKSFSAVGYYFARKRSREQGTAVGVLNASLGGTPVEAWMPKDTLLARPDFAAIFPPWEKWAAVDYPPIKAKFDAETLPAWEKASAEAKAKGQPIPAKPRIIAGPDNNAHQPALLYNGMIAPLMPYGLKGVLWYQGESNVARAAQYRDLFPTMIATWRARWDQPNLPFLFVQIAGFNGYGPPPPAHESDYAELREAQAMALKLPHTGMAVITDVSDAGNIHPPNKVTVGGRLAAMADVVADSRPERAGWCSPLYAGCAVTDTQVTVRFAHTGGALNARGGEPLRGFLIAGEDRRFVEAVASIAGETVVVSSPNVGKPVAVRYGWANVPTGNLCGADGLPASPFRTDDWPGITTGKIAPAPW